MQTSLKIQIFDIVIEAKISLLCKGTASQRAIEHFRQPGAEAILFYMFQLIPQIDENLFTFLLPSCKTGSQKRTDWRSFLSVKAEAVCPCPFLVLRSNRISSPLIVSQ